MLLATLVFLIVLNALVFLAASFTLRKTHLRFNQRESGRSYRAYGVERASARGAVHKLSSVRRGCDFW